MYPTFSDALRQLLLLPVATATIDRSFSTLNRILSDKRCHLTLNHACQLMLMSVEGPDIPYVRASASAEQKKHGRTAQCCIYGEPHSQILGVLLLRGRNGRKKRGREGEEGEGGGGRRGIEGREGAGRGGTGVHDYALIRDAIDFHYKWMEINCKYNFITELKLTLI